MLKVRLYLRAHVLPMERHSRRHDVRPLLWEIVRWRIEYGQLLLHSQTSLPMLKLVLVANLLFPFPGRLRGFAESASLLTVRVPARCQPELHLQSNSHRLQNVNLLANCQKQNKVATMSDLRHRNARQSGTWSHGHPRNVVVVRIATARSLFQRSATPIGHANITLGLAHLRRPRPRALK